MQIGIRILKTDLFTTTKEEKYNWLLLSPLQNRKRESDNQKEGI